MTLIFTPKRLFIKYATLQEDGWRAQCVTRCDRERAGLTRSDITSKLGKQLGRQQNNFKNICIFTQVSNIFLFA